MKRTKIFLFTLVIFIVIVKGYAQQIEYSALSIPDSLTTNSNAVIRSNILEITIESETKKTVKHKRVITVLNKSGNRFLGLYQYYDNDRKIKFLNAKIYDAFGHLIKKISGNKFTDVSATDGFSLYSDDRVKYINYTPTSYPFTAVFESETEDSSTGIIPPWNPIYNYSVSIEKSIYKISNPLNIPFRKREKNFENYAIKNLSQGNTIHYELHHQPAKFHETSALPYYDILPNVSIALDKFTLKKVKGAANNWKELGQWMYDYLLKNRDVLDDTTKNHVRDLVKDAKTDIEKAKIIYEYMQNRTRYVSVQIDIGGWMPISAVDVHKLGYGDCKGLSNYTKALLDAVGVESYYTIVYAKERRDIDKDFASIQGNHAILNIPNNGNDIWLECTSQIMPFGFLGDFTDDRDVLVVTPEGGVIKRTSAYKNEQNLQTVSSHIILNDDGNITAEVTRQSKGIQYDDKFHYEQKSKDDLIKYYKTNVWDYNNNLDINAVKVLNDKDSISYTEKVNLTINDFATINDTELLFRVNLFNRYTYIPKRYRNRHLDFKVNRGFLDIDEFHIEIPPTYSNQIEPIEKTLDTKFGTYKMSVEKKGDNLLIYKKHFLVKDGVYPKEDYKSYRSFIKKVVKLDNMRISLKKK